MRIRQGDSSLTPGFPAVPLGRPRARRSFSRKERRWLFVIAGGICQQCGADLDPTFHADHILPFSKGGLTTLSNGQALCRNCNLKKGSSDGRYTSPSQMAE